MKRITLAIIGTIAIFSTSLADARTQRGYIKRDGTYCCTTPENQPRPTAISIIVDQKQIAVSSAMNLAIRQLSTSQNESRNNDA